jgi:outer membrane lipoprotein carrier protein
MPSIFFVIIPKKRKKMKKTLLLFIVLYSFAFEIKYKSFISDFNQSITTQKKHIYYKGKVYVKNNFIYWHYIKPIEKKIWIKNNKIYIYEPDLEQVTIYKNNKNNFFKLIKNAKKIKNNLYLKEYDNKKIYFKTKNNLIKRIYYKDKVDNLVTLNFYNIQKKDINSSVFIPNYPNYVDIIYAK